MEFVKQVGNGDDKTCKKIVSNIDEIGDTASKEFKYETLLHTMQEEWEPTDFECKDYKDGQGYILDGEAIEVIQTLLDDHIVKTQTMKGSAYVKHFLQDILDWEVTLLKTQDNLEVWLKVQHVWMYLEPVFSSEDIMQ